MGLGIKDKEIPLRANIETVRVSQIFLLSRTRRGSRPYSASYAAAYRAVLFYSLTCRTIVLAPCFSGLSDRASLNQPMRAPSLGGARCQVRNHAVELKQLAPERT
jgi:hypothetical protein